MTLTLVISDRLREELRWSIRLLRARDLEDVVQWVAFCLLLADLEYVAQRVAHFLVCVLRFSKYIAERVFGSQWLVLIERKHRVKVNVNLFRGWQGLLLLLSGLRDFVGFVLVGEGNFILSIRLFNFILRLILVRERDFICYWLFRLLNQGLFLLFSDLRHFRLGFQLRLALGSGLFRLCLIRCLGCALRSSDVFVFSPAARFLL